VPFSLAGGAFVNTAWLNLGESTEGLLSFTGGTINLGEGGSVTGSGTFQVLNSVLNTDLDLGADGHELFFSEVELNGPGNIVVQQDTSRASSRTWGRSGSRTT
jgi:hypothetical protein